MLSLNKGNENFCRYRLHKLGTPKVLRRADGVDPLLNLLSLIENDLTVYFYLRRAGKNTQLRYFQCGSVTALYNFNKSYYIIHVLETIK